MMKSICYSVHLCYEVPTISCYLMFTNVIRLKLPLLFIEHNGRTVLRTFATWFILQMQQKSSSFRY